MRTKTAKIISILLICCILFAAGAPTVSAYEDSPLQNWIVREFNQTNGLPTGEANTVIQTSDGYVWIGSYGGLIRYDGTTFRNYSEEGSIESSSIRALFEDGKGRLWIGTNDMGVYLCENNEFTQLANDNSNAYLSVRSFAECDGTVYAGTTSGLAKVSENGIEAVEAVTGTTVYSMQADKNGVLWTCLDNGISQLLKNDEVIYTFDSAKFLNAALYCAGADKEGDLWLGTDGSLIYEVSFKDGDYTDNSFIFTEYSTGTISTFNAIGEDLKGNVWAAALNGTGYLDAEGDWHSTDTEHAAAANDLAFDYEGNIWIASTSHGVIHLVSGLYCNPNAASELSETSLNTVAVSGDSYYIGTDTGLIILDSRFARVENELTRELEGDRIRNILADSRGNIWVGTYYSNGLVLYEPDTKAITHFTQEEGLTNSQIRHIIELSDGGIAAATQSGVNIIRSGKVTETYTEAEGLNYPIILTLCEGGDGTLYAGSDGQGIFAIKDGKVTQYGFDQGLPAGVVLRMIPDSSGSNLFISAGNSLYYWDHESFTHIDNYRKNAGSIFDMHIVGDQLWLMQSNGVNIVNINQLMSGEETPVNLIGAAYGLTGSLNANTWNVIRDGTLYLCTSNGLSVLELDALNADNAKINIVISQVTADDITFENPDFIDIAGDTTRLTFRFAPLAFTGTEVTVRYRLVGFDDRAYTLTNDSAMSASYTNLSGGDYEFVAEVLGRDGETVIAKSSVTVHKDHNIWERPWFWVLTAAAALLLVLLVTALIIRAKTITLRRRQQEYRDITSQALRTFAHTIDAKDKYTNGHSARVAHYSLEIARKLKMSEEDQERIYYIALLHDIGKIGIPDYILTKPDKLTPEERQMIMRHPTIGGEILKDFTSLEGISDGARYHHERYDGTGYNEGLKGEEIPFFARIICVADSYDAMSSVRYYQGNLSSEVIIKELEEGSGSQFDPRIVEIMLQLIREGKAPCSELLKPLDDIAEGLSK